MVLAVHDPAADVAFIDTYGWSADGRAVYFLGYDPRDRLLGFFRLPAAGGTPRLVLRFDDPDRTWHRNGFRVRGGRFYFTRATSRATSG